MNFYKFIICGLIIFSFFSCSKTEFIKDDKNIPEDTGLSMEFKKPDKKSGKTLNVLEIDKTITIDNEDDDDSIGIQNVIDKAEDGDTVYLPAGTYHLKQSISLKTGVNFTGKSMEETILYSKSKSSIKFVKIPAGANNFTVSNFSIFADKSHDIDTGIQVNVNGVNGRNPHQIVIANIKIEGFKRFGIAIYNANHILVMNCRILNATELGGGGRGYGIMLSDNENHDNWIFQNEIGPVIRHSVLLQFFAHNNLVEYNSAYGNAQDAYDLHGEDEYLNELRFNVAYDSERAGFGVGNTGSTHDASGPNNYIHDNEVYNCLEGVELIQDSDYVYIENNYFHDMKNQAIKIEDKGGDNIYIRNNIIENNPYGVYSLRSDNLFITENEFRGNENAIFLKYLEVNNYAIVKNTFENNKINFFLRGKPKFSFKKKGFEEENIYK